MFSLHHVFFTTPTLNLCKKKKKIVIETLFFPGSQEDSWCVCMCFFSYLPCQCSHIHLNSPVRLRSVHSTRFFFEGVICRKSHSIYSQQTILFLKKSEALKMIIELKAFNLSWFLNHNNSKDMHFGLHHL